MTYIAEVETRVYNFKNQAVGSMCMGGRGTLFRMTIHTLLKCSHTHYWNALIHTIETLSYTLLKHSHTLLRFCSVLNRFREMSPIILTRKGFIECLMTIQELYLLSMLLWPDKILGIEMSVTYWDHCTGVFAICFRNMRADGGLLMQIYCYPQ